MHRSVLAVLLLASCVQGQGGSPEAGVPTEPGGLVTVVRVVDGDTLWVLRDGREEKIRLIGVDTPEVDWYGGEAECYGEEAGRFARRLLEDGSVELELDRDLLDPYDRTLAYVYLEDGRMVNLLLVRRGYAIVSIYEPNDRYEDRLRDAEADARAGGLGLWSAC